MSEPSDKELAAWRLTALQREMANSIAAALHRRPLDHVRQDVEAIIEASLNPSEQGRPIGALKRLAQAAGIELTREIISSASEYLGRNYRVERNIEVDAREEMMQLDFENERLGLRFLNLSLKYEAEGKSAPDSRARAADEIWWSVQRRWPDNEAQRRKWHPPGTEKALRDRFNAIAKQHEDDGFLRHTDANKPPAYSIKDLTLKPGRPLIGSPKAKSTKKRSV